ncbi:MAG TPA: FtsX-like permease family protein [Gaiellaceae bacterium]|nr:FtsX-like permease family protein [Gaiellaceae bacterium]
MTGRRAIIRWASRMFRREWRAQLLVLALLTVAVAAAIGSITIVYNTAPADNSRFGSANTLLTFDGSDPQKLHAGLADARKSFGTIDVIAHHSVAVPGSVETIDFRTQDPAGKYGHELLALRRGRYPTRANELAVTDRVAALLRLRIGSNPALDHSRWRVVGIVENPRKLSDEFVLTSPSATTGADYVTVLAKTTVESAKTFGAGPDTAHTPALTSLEISGNDHPGAPTLAMFSVTTVFLLLASLVAAAGFAVVAQRRLRQLGMLAAIGASEKQVRLVLVANGAVVGAIAAIVGTAVGLAAWIVFAPTLESALDHRVDRLSLPWWLIATTGLLALLGATAAAWWPGRAAARLPVVLALSGRPPKPRPARYSALAAAGLIALGVALLALSNRDRAVLIVAGIVATIIGALLMGPLAIRIFSRLAGRVSIAPRLALRDLVRFQARSGAALAAVTLALGIAASVVVVASAEAAKKAAQPPTLSDRQIRVLLGSEQEAREFTPVDAEARLPHLSASVRRLADGLHGGVVLPLRRVMQPGVPPMVVGDTRFLLPLDITRRTDNMYRPVAQLYVATAAVLRYLGVDPGTLDPSTDFLLDRSARTEGLSIPSLKGRGDFPVTNVRRIDIGVRRFGSGIDSRQEGLALITIDGLRRHGWKQIPAGWLVESRQPLTSDQIATARQIAADAGLAIEVKDTPGSNARIKGIATAAGAALALAVLAMTVGLIRSESAGDLRTLTAAGATSRIRRTLTASTAGALAFLGAVLGVAGAYVVLLATYHDDLGYLRDVPFVHLALAVVGVPVAAAAAGWLLSGREPRTIARAVID